MIELFISHLDGTVLHSGGVVLDSLTRPSLLITDAYNSQVVHPARKDRYAAMFGKKRKEKNSHFLTDMYFCRYHVDFIK